MPPKEPSSRLRGWLSLITVEPILFLFMFAASLMWPTVQALVYRKVCLKNFNLTVCDNLSRSEFEEAEDVVQKESAHWYLIENLCYEIPSILASFFYGNVSDHVSRRVALILPLIGQMISSVNYIINAAVIELPIGLILLGPLISGWFGGWVGICLATFSHLSECSSRETRTVRISIAESVISISLAISFFAGGAILDNTSYTFVCSTALVLYFICFLYTYFVVKNPQKQDTESTHTPTYGFVQKIKMTMSPKSVKKSLMVAFRKRQMHRRPHILVLLGLSFLGMVANNPSYTLAYLYVKRHPLSWSQSLYGYYVGFRLAVSAVSLIAIVPLMKAKLHMRETTIMIIAAVLAAASEVLFGFSLVTWMVFMVPIVNFLGGATTTCARSLLSSFVESTEYGQAFAVFGSLQSISGLVSSLIYNNLYPATITIWAGLSFIVGASLAIVPLGMLVWLHIDLKRVDRYKVLREEVFREIVSPIQSSEEPSLQTSESEPETRTTFPEEDIKLRIPLAVIT